MNALFNRKQKMRKFYIILAMIIFMWSCSETPLAVAVLSNDEQPETENSRETRSALVPPLRLGFDEFTRQIPIPEASDSLRKIFNADTAGTYLPRYTQEDMDFYLDGYVTSNFDFYEKVLKPVLLENRTSLLAMEKYQAINCLTLFMHESYQTFFGLSYYRWGGDITDRDQPQVEGHTRSSKRYGLDCSGFAASAYETAVMLGILDSTQTEGRFSWNGFKYLCEHDPEYADGGGRSGTTNNYRLEVFEMADIGMEIAIIPAGQSPTDTQLAAMQAGDLVIKSGHTGILVEINEELYFLESGGSTLNENGLYTAYRAKEAITDFAGSRTTGIYRCLPEKEAHTAIVQY